MVTILHPIVPEDVIYHRLECGRTVCEAEEHDQRFEKASVRPKGSLPLVLFFDLMCCIPSKHPA